MPAFKNITGLRFGRWTALERQASKHQLSRWLCRCDCGVTKVVFGNGLWTGKTKSCGCFNVDAHRTHGQWRTRAYKAWWRARQRCENPRNASFARYGGRGVKVRYPFETFFADMGDCPPGCDLHRLDNDSDYEPGNCVLLPHSEHMRLHAPYKTRSSAAK
jgi:hypothetical protein